MLDTIEQSTLVYEKFGALLTILIIFNKCSSRLKSDGTILGAISAMGVVDIEIRLPNLKLKRIKVDVFRRRKQPQPKKPASKGTVTGHYMLFLQNTMNFMDQFPEMKGFYVVMDNASIHIALLKISNK